MWCVIENRGISVVESQSLIGVIIWGMFRLKSVATARKRRLTKFPTEREETVRAMHADHLKKVGI